MSEIEAEIEAGIEAQLKKIAIILSRIESILQEIDRKISAEEEKEFFDPFTLLELPDNLRKTFMALLRLKEATATEIASVTKRGRAIESHYLNTLVKMGYAGKRRDGRKVYYLVKGKKEL